jgi:hypothetical protein
MAATTARGAMSQRPFLTGNFGDRTTSVFQIETLEDTMKRKIRDVGIAVGFLALSCIPAALAQHAKVVDVTEVNATVETVDLHQRTILLSTQDGLVTIEAGPAVKNLAQVKPGDKIHVVLREALVARLTTASPSTAPEVHSDAMTGNVGGTATDYQRNEIKANVRITDIDQAAHIVKFVGPAGVERVAHLRDPSMIAMLQKVKVGDVVEMKYSVAVAVRLERAAG